MKKTTLSILKFAATIVCTAIASVLLLIVIFKPMQQVIGSDNGVGAVQENSAPSEIALVNSDITPQDMVEPSNYLNIDAEWSTWFMPPFNTRDTRGKEQVFTIDLNGDGLLDHIIAYRGGGVQNPTYQDQVYLGNGQGWNLVYDCQINYSSSSPAFQGSCATDTEPESEPSSAPDGCFTDYRLWSYSRYYQENDWDWGKISFKNYDSDYADWLEHMIDLNGDGLPDYIWANKSDGNREQRSCVYLNNGSGWDLAYRCVHVDPPGDYGNDLYYYGDCAQ